MAKFLNVLAAAIIALGLGTVMSSESNASPSSYHEKTRCATLRGLGEVCGLTLEEIKSLIGNTGTGNHYKDAKKHACSGKKKYDFVCLKKDREGRCIRGRRITRHGCE